MEKTEQIVEIMSQYLQEVNGKHVIGAYNLVEIAKKIDALYNTKWEKTYQRRQNLDKYLVYSYDGIADFNTLPEAMEYISKLTYEIETIHLYRGKEIEIERVVRVSIKNSL